MYLLKGGFKDRFFLFNSPLRRTVTILLSAGIFTVSFFGGRFSFADEIKIGLVKEQFDTFKKVGEGNGKVWASGTHWYFPFKDVGGKIKRVPTNIWLTDKEYNQLKDRKEITVKFRDTLITLFLEGKYEVPDNYIYGYDILE